MEVGCTSFCVPERNRYPWEICDDNISLQSGRQIFHGKGPASEWYWK